MVKPTVKHWQDLVNLLLGLWLLVSPWVLKYQAEKSLMWSAVVFGVLIAAVGVLALHKAAGWQAWGSLVLGICTLITPWIHASGSAVAATNATIVGIVVAVLAGWVLATDKDTWGWWSPAT